MTQAQKDRNWHRLCGGKPAPLVLRAATEIPLLHPERNSDPRWQWRKFSRAGPIEKLRSRGILDENRLHHHFSAADHQGGRAWESLNQQSHARDDGALQIEPRKVVGVDPSSPSSAPVVAAIPCRTHAQLRTADALGRLTTPAEPTVAGAKAPDRRP